MNRRNFLQQATILASACISAKGEAAEGRVMTVLGPIEASAMGFTLPHEHVLVDFIGAEQATPARYEPEEVVKTALPHLRRIRELGCKTFIDCTPAYIGRDPLILRRLASETGLHILTNAGYYGAAEDKYVPRRAYSETAEQLAERWVSEWKNGIADTGIRPGFIKIGVDSGRLSEIDEKLARAAALTHLETGLTIASHTGSSVAALDQIGVLDETGVSPQAWIWVHARKDPGSDALVVAARKGAWIEFDSIAPERIRQNVDLVQGMKQARLLDRVLISQDAGWYHVGEPGGGRFRPFDSLFVDFLPALKRAGFEQKELSRITVQNPADAFTIKVRRK
jgi:phosphotriesterase-related protein